MRPVERVLVRLDDGAAGAVLRVALGYAIGLTWLQLAQRQAPGWAIVPLFLAVLVAVRVVPVLLRSIGRFSEPVRRVWTERRQMAKRYDSYQWRKLLWIGSGLMLHAPASSRRSGALLALASVCVTAGAVGLAVWRAKARGRSGSSGPYIATSGTRSVAGVVTVGGKA
jgi:hypothetical protein